MRRFAEVTAIAVTAYFLIATSQAPCTATPEMLSLTARTTCGPDTPQQLTLDSSCQITLSDSTAGLPTRGFSRRTGLRSGGGELYGRLDAGTEHQCLLSPNDAGFDVSCSIRCDDGGSCGECSGSLAP